MKRTRKNPRTSSPCLTAGDLARVGGGFGGEDLGPNVPEETKRRWYLTGSSSAESEV